MPDPNGHPCGGGAASSTITSSRIQAVTAGSASPGRTRRAAASASSTVREHRVVHRARRRPPWKLGCANAAPGREQTACPCGGSVGSPSCVGRMLRAPPSARRGSMDSGFWRPRLGSAPMVDSSKPWSRFRMYTAPPSGVAPACEVSAEKSHAMADLVVRGGVNRGRAARVPSRPPGVPRALEGLRPRWKARGEPDEVAVPPRASSAWWRIPAADDGAAEEAPPAAKTPAAGEARAAAPPAATRVEPSCPKLRCIRGRPRAARKARRRRRR